MPEDVLVYLISIHALREEGDPTTPVRIANHSGFLSTPSARRATRPCLRAVWGGKGISIHALREEGDLYFVFVV